MVDLYFTTFMKFVLVLIIVYTCIRNNFTITFLVPLSILLFCAMKLCSNIFTRTCSIDSQHLTVLVEIQVY